MSLRAGGTLSLLNEQLFIVIEDIDENIFGDLLSAVLFLKSQLSKVISAIITKIPVDGAEL